MKKMFFKCRRTLTAWLAILCLTYLGSQGGAEVAAAIATIVLAVAGANSAQAIMQKKKDDDEQT